VVLVGEEGETGTRSAAEFGEELGKHAHSEMVKARLKFGKASSGVVHEEAAKAAGLELNPAEVLKFYPEATVEQAVAVVAIVEYMLAECIELGHEAAKSARVDGIRAADIRTALKNDEELCRFFDSKLEGIGAPAQGTGGAAAQPETGAQQEQQASTEAGSACRQWCNTEDLEDQVGIPCLLYWQTVGRECDGTDAFPLQRWNCGHWMPAEDGSVDHSNHDPERVRTMERIAIALTTHVNCWGRYECSDVDAEYTAISAYVPPDELPSRNPADVAVWLARRLRLNEQYASAFALPIGPEYADHMLTPFPDGGGDPHPFEKRFSDTMRAELTDWFHFRGAADSGTELINTYPVVFAGFTPHGDIAGVFAIRTDT